MDEMALQIHHPEGPSRLVLTPTELADMLQISMPSMYALLKRRVRPIPSFKFGRKWLIPLAGVDQWLAEEAEYQYIPKGGAAP